MNFFYSKKKNFSRIFLKKLPFCFKKKNRPNLQNLLYFFFFYFKSNPLIYIKSLKNLRLLIFLFMGETNSKRSFFIIVSLSVLAIKSPKIIQKNSEDNIPYMSDHLKKSCYFNL